MEDLGRFTVSSWLPIRNPLRYSSNANSDTSKQDTAKPLYGRDGTFLHSLAAVSLLSITSRHSSHRAYSTISFHRSRVISRLVPAPPHHYLSAREHGTRVTVRDLFGNMPVRVKHRAVVSLDPDESNREWDSLKKSIVALLLAWGRPVTVVGRDPDGKSKLLVRGLSSGSLLDSVGSEAERNRSFQVAAVQSVLSQVGYISPSDWNSWVTTSARTISVTIRGVFSLQPAPSKYIQFISLGIRPVYVKNAGNELYDSINRIFEFSSFGTLEDMAEAGDLERGPLTKDRRLKRNEPTNKQLKGGGKCVDRWPMFYLHIDTHRPDDLCLAPRADFIENQEALKAIIDVLTEMTTQFLKEHHFRVGRRRHTRPVGTTPERPNSSTSSGTFSLSLGAADLNRTRDRVSTAVTVLRAVTSNSSTLPHHSVSSCTAATREADDNNSKLVQQGISTVDSIRIPSFSRPQREDQLHGFNSWSRMKAGKRAMLGDVCSVLPTTRARQRPMQFSSGSDAERLPKYPEAVRLPITEATGTSWCPASIGREDALRMQIHTSPCIVPSGSSEDSRLRSSVGHVSRTAELEEHGADADHILLWTNPISKATLRVSSRTGIIVPRHPPRPFSAPSAAPSLTIPAGFGWPRPANLSLLKHSLKIPRRTPETESWIGKLLQDWDNPVFRQTEEAIPQVEICGISSDATQLSHVSVHRCLKIGDDLGFQHSSKLSGKLTKGALKKCEIIAQVDHKFILVKMEVESTSLGVESSAHTERPLLVLIDQHAADERCRIEGLLAELCRPPSTEGNAPSKLDHPPQVITTPLSKHITFPTSVHERDLFRLHTGHFASWGILYDVVDRRKRCSTNELEVGHSIIVKSLPPVIAERCKAEVAHLVGLLRGEVWRREGEDRSRGSSSKRPSLHNNASAAELESGEGEDGATHGHRWLHRVGDCPQGILDMLNSRACRSAIMFNDQLSREQCQELISKLAECAFPFQCAHGRPSMIPLVDLGDRCQERPGVVALSAFRKQSIKEVAKLPAFVETFSKWKVM